MPSAPSPKGKASRRASGRVTTQYTMATPQEAQAARSMERSRWAATT